MVNGLFYFVELFTEVIYQETLRYESNKVLLKIKMY